MANTMRMLDFVRFKYCPRCGRQSLKSEGVKSFTCLFCSFVYYHGAAAVSVGILEFDEKIILTKRANEPQKGFLALPGGFVDYEESLEDALIRELKEELNLTVTNPAYLCSHWERYLFRDVLYFSTIAYFVVRLEDISAAKANDEIDAYSLVRANEIDPEKLAFQSDKIALERYILMNQKPEIPASFSHDQYASFALRMKAFAYDYPIIFAYILLLVGIGFGVNLAFGPLDEISPLFTSPVFWDAVAFSILILPVGLYFALQESSSKQATWGKRLAKIRVVNADGERLSRIKALIRSAVKFLPWQIAHTSIYQIKPDIPGVEPSFCEFAGFMIVYVLVGIYIASVFISKKRRTPYDWAVGSYVVVQK